MTKSILISTALMFLIMISKAQTTIPNAGFENWTSMGTYNNPDGWDQLNGMTSAMSVCTCEKGTPGSVGASYLKLTSKTVTGIGVVPGVAVCGVLDVVSMQPKSGFPFTAQPQSLTGKWQHMIFGSSQGFIDVKLTRWDNGSNSRVVVATGHVNLTGMAMSWANFSIPLSYNETNAPDSCIIAMSASGTAPANNDYLWVDALAFTGSVTGLKQTDAEAKVTVSPNPSSSYLTIDIPSLNNEKVSVKIIDIQGKEVMEVQSINNSSKINLDISTLSKGNYVINILTKHGMITSKFIKE